MTIDRIRERRLGFFALGIFACDAAAFFVLVVFVVLAVAGTMNMPLGIFGLVVFVSARIAEVWIDWKSDVES